MSKENIQFEDFNGTVFDTAASSYTSVEGSGNGLIYNGSGSMTSYVTSSTTHTRDVWLHLDDGSQIHRRYFADIPIRKGQRLVEITAKEKGNATPFAVFFPETQDTWLIDRRGFALKSSSMWVSIFKAVIAFFVVGYGLSFFGSMVDFKMTDSFAVTFFWSCIGYSIFDMILRARRNYISEQYMRQKYETLIRKYSVSPTTLR